MDERFENLLKEIEKLHHRHELSKTVTPDYFEPGMMEHLDKTNGVYEPETGRITLRFEAKGTRYEGRTEYIEKMQCGDRIVVLRDRANPFNSNNFTMENARGCNVGHFPAELCNVIAPLYDSGRLTIGNALVSYVEPLTKRNRHAKQAVLFVEVHCQLK